MEDQDLMREQAQILTDRAYRHQIHGELGDAIALYRRSIAMYPTAEAHTYLGWAYNMMDRNEEAIAECEKAILLDPDLGNPYNDIGAYLLELGRPAEAIPWFEQAIAAPRYDMRVYAFFNLGRACERTGQWLRAIDGYRQATILQPDFRPAQMALQALLGRLN